jgi:hypothetical protein
MLLMLSSAVPDGVVLNGVVPNGVFLIAGVPSGLTNPLIWHTKAMPFMNMTTVNLCQRIVPYRVLF